MMKLPARRMLSCAFALSASLGVARADLNVDFSSPITLGNAQAPDTWYKDRYVPAGFESQQSFMGDDRLLQTISASDAQASAFYNTQGRKFDLEPGTFATSIDLYVDSNWTSASADVVRFAGFWATGFDGAAAVSSYPILEISRYDGNLGVYAWDPVNGGFTLEKALLASDLDAFHNLGIRLDGGNLEYTFDGATIATFASGGTESLGNVILQGYNTTGGVDRSIYWDNLSAQNTAVPEPASVISAATALGLAGLVAARRRRRAASA